MKRILIAAALLLTAAPAHAEWKSLGEWRVTGYCACRKCCGKSDGVTADGTRAKAAREIILSAPKGIPFGARVWIDGVGEAVVHDRGGAIRGHRMELLFPSHRQAKAWGVQKRMLFLWAPSAPP